MGPRRAAHGGTSAAQQGTQGVRTVRPVAGGALRPVRARAPLVRGPRSAVRAGALPRRCARDVEPDPRPLRSRAAILTNVKERRPSPRHAARMRALVFALFPLALVAQNDTAWRQYVDPAE